MGAYLTTKNWADSCIAATFSHTQILLHVWSTILFYFFFPCRVEARSLGPQVIMVNALHPVTMFLVLNEFPPVIAVSTASKAIPLENPPETSAQAKESASAEEARSQATCDQANGVAANQEVTREMEASGLNPIPLSQQGLTAEVAGASAGLAPLNESLQSAEAVSVSSELHICEGAVIAGEENQFFISAEELTTQEVMLTSEEQSGVPGGKTSADPKLCTSEDGKASDDAETVVEGLKNMCLDAAQDGVDAGDVNVTMDTQNENVDKTEPVILLSEVIQSMDAAKSEAQPVSTRHLSGWFMFCETRITLNTSCLFMIYLVPTFSIHLVGLFLFSMWS